MKKHVLCCTHCVTKLDLKMKFAAICLLFFLFRVNANTYSQVTKVTLDVKNATVEEILFSKIEKNTDFKFFYENSVPLDLDKKVSIESNALTIDKVLNKLFSDTNIRYEIFDKQIILSQKPILANFEARSATKAQNNVQQEVTGSIVDETGVPVPGVSVVEKNTSNGVAADFDGNYSIMLSDPNATLVFSSIGYTTQEIEMGESSVLNVTLISGAQNLDEVVVVGYGTQRRKDLTGSVSSVDGELFKNQPITNPVAALQGRTAGVNVVQGSGEPGTPPSIVIRGLSSFNQPQPLFIVDGIRVPDINNINVQDIASMDVLKDAAGAAIYGSAAAGGVLVITTKKGTPSESGPLISFSARYGVTTPKLVKLLGRDDFIRLTNIIQPAAFAGVSQAELDQLADTDWVDIIYGSGVEQNYNLSISGSSPKVNYLISGFYNGQEGNYRKNYSNIGGLRINTDYQLSKKVKIGEQISITRRTGAPTIGNPYNAPFRSVPIIPIFDEDGTFGSVPDGINLAFSGPNPFGVIETVDVENTQNNLQVNLYADIKLPFNLSFRSTLGYTNNVETQDLFQNAFNFGAVVQANNFLQKNFFNFSQLLTNYVLTYDKDFGKHSVNAIAGFEQITSKTNSIFANESAIGLPGFTFIQTSNSEISLNGTNDPNGLIKSVFGRVNYNFDGKYYLSGSIREDANFTVFGPNEQRGVFPAVSGGWNLSEEEFFKGSDSKINLLKLRASWGSLGNSNIAPYSFAAAYSQFGTSTGGQNFSPGSPLLIANTISGIPNPDVKWETVNETNIAIDAELFDGDLYLTAEWYKKDTKDMLYSLQLPTSTGFTSPFLTNIGEVTNVGVDLLVGFRNSKSDFKYDISATAGFNKNEVVSLAGAATDAVFDGFNYYTNGDPGFNVSANQNLTVTRAGLPFGSFFGFKSLGIFATDEEAASQTVNNQVARAGDLIFEDVDENGVIDDLDRQVIGNPNPKVVYGINMNFRYKGLDLALLFNGAAGVDLYNGVRAYEQSLFADGNSTSKIFGNSFFDGNGLTSQPRLGVVQDDGGFLLDPNRNYSSVNSYFVEDGSYLKLRNIQLGYSFANNVLKQIGATQARIFVMGDNLFTFTKYTGQDPELGSSFSPFGSGAVTTQGVDAVPSYAQRRTVSLGLDINF